MPKPRSKSFVKIKKIFVFLIFRALIAEKGYGNKAFSAENFALKQQKAAFLRNITEKRTFVERNYNAGECWKASKKAAKAKSFTFIFRFSLNLR